MIMLVLLCVILALIIGFFGRNLRFGFWGYFFVSILFTPIIGFLILIAALPTSETRPRKATRQ
jgi:hypothetical protein